MGWTVLYIAFGGVALWLLGEVLLQYKARLRWRLLAFAGFLGVVVGVMMPSVLVIGAGAIAFAVGQTLVTLSFRRGFAAGWAVRRPEAGAAESGGSKRRRGRGDRNVRAAQAPAPAPAGPADEPAPGQDPYAPDGSVPDAYDDYDRDDVFSPARPPADGASVYEPQPLPEDTGNYGVYGDTATHAAQQQGQSYDYSGYGQQQGYGYEGAPQQGYANYSDPYIGSRPYAADGYDPGYAQQYGQQGYAQDPYATGGYGETPAGGVWVPQQRTDEGEGGELPQEQPYPYQGHGRQQPGAGYDEQQYRY
ncbi:SCO2102 family sporulation regulator [Streptomyces sp. HF10]|uniref:SCO2102 family sporulation regulator n=1 Tax=Streptomyces sp. HF10 TaxID=2692233 RepID=UPI001315DDAB|nr:hypothetical protein [Streptomyces sp. HF10]QHC29069.1 hypothetical protein GR129_09760 [Streptomyces sp. HF10]